MIPNAAVFVIPGDPETRTGGYIYDKLVLLALRRMGRPVRLLRMPDGFPTPSAQAEETSGARLAALNPDVPVIMDGLFAGALAPAQFDRLKAPYIAMVHHPLALETGLSADLAAKLHENEATNLTRAAHVVVPSPNTRDDLVNDYCVPAEKITVALPGVEEVVSPRARSTPPLILSVGSLVPRKGHDILLSALGRIADLPWQAVIAGKALDPKTAEALRAQANHLGLSARVEFRGEVSKTQLSELYLHATIFALATRLEGYGMVFAEALSHGVPVVTCNNSAIPDVVPSDAGALVPTDDDAAFAAALRKLLTDPAALDAAEAGAAKAGAALPRWADTAGHMAAVLDRVAQVR